MSKRAVLMMTFGSPEEITYEGVAEFFTNIRRGVRPELHEIQTLYDQLPPNRWNAAPKDNKGRSGLGCYCSWKSSVGLLCQQIFPTFIITDAIKEMEQ